MTTFRAFSTIFNAKTKIKMVIILAAIISGAVLELLALALMEPFMGALLDGDGLPAGWFGRAFDLLGFSDSGMFLAFLAFLLVATYVGKGLYMVVLARVQQRFMAGVQSSLSSRLMDKALNRSYLYHADHNIAEIQKTILQDVARLSALINSAFAFLADFFMTLLMITFLLLVSPIMTLAVLALALLCMGVYLLLFRKRLVRLGEARSAAYGGMIKGVNQSLGGIKEVKILGRELYFLNSFNKSNRKYTRVEAHSRFISVLPKLMIETICFGGVFALLGVVIMQGIDMSDFVAQMSVFVVAAFRLMPALSRQAGTISNILYHRSAVSAVFESLRSTEDVYGAGDIPRAGLPGIAEEDIVISGLAFKYPRGEENVLHDVSFSIAPNKSVAFIGPSGAGKTTLADIILGVLTPQSGGVYYRGKSIHHHFAEWSGQVGYIPQQIYLLDETIRENVAFGIATGDIDEGKVWRALEQAQLADFVRALPDGLDTVVGDRGVRLSGGQRQRVGIARAMYEDPPILVLDEATSSLDNETEQAVMEAVMGFKGNKTMIIIAHRLSTIEHCDMVYKVENKTVTQVR